MTRTKNISVVIPHGGSIGTLKKQLQALAEQTVHADEIIVSCNRPGSKQALEQQLANTFLTSLPLVLVDSSATRGPSAARNAGWSATQGDVVLFCDDDDIADTAWVAELSESLKQHAVSGGSLRYERLNSSRAARRSSHAETAAPTKFGHLPYAPSANLGVRREVLVATGGFDVRTNCAEDIDFCWRAQYAGFQFGFARDAIMHYRLRRGFRSASRQSYQYGLSDGWLLTQHREHGARRSLAEGAKELAGIPLSLWRAVTGRGDLVDTSQRICGFAGRVVSTIHYRAWVI